MTRGLKAMIVLAGAMLFGAAAASAAEDMTPAEKALYEAAKSEGEVTWYVAHFTSEVAEKIADGFAKRYPGLKGNVVRTTGQVAFQRLSSDMKAGAHVCDVLSTSDSGHLWYLKGKGQLVQYTPENAAKLVPDFRGLDPDGFFHITAVTMTVIAYRKDKIAPADVPTNWTDLIDPKWKGQVALGHPGFSGTVGVWSVLMRKLYGPDFLKKLAANEPQVGRSINDVVTMLNAGERLLGHASINTVSNSIARGNPLAISFAKDGTLLQILPSGIIKGGPHPNAGKLFMEYLLSVDASRIMAANEVVPMRSEVEPPPGFKPFSEIKLVRPSEEELRKGIPEVKEAWRDEFGS